jgi:hypothetical protein
MSILIMAMATQGHGFNMLSTILGLLVSIVCYAFVDDTNIIHAAASTSVKGEEVIGQMQEILDRWGGLLQATGGALVPKKSYWYAIDFKWMASSWKYRTIDDMPGNIFITGVDGEQVVLTRYNPLSLKKP